MGPENTSVRCCIAGGGPAGMMLGYLLARAGVKVLVLEKHGDFLRDFRGDTIHPSTLEVMHELGLLDEFLKLPHQKVYELNAQVGEMRLKLVVAIVMVAFDCGLLDGAVHAFDLTVRPRMLHLCKSVLDAVFLTAHAKHVRHITRRRPVVVALP